ncbi:MAG: peptidylprolyl isomerase [Chitinophagaceae bacterium]|nr:MAG: peptidylprolyl isomerase [Chitinophagaceae bacterium]
MKKILLLGMALLSLQWAIGQKDVTVKKKDRKKDILLQTNYGDIVLRLSDSTPLHRDNFLKIVKSGYYDSVLFHRVIARFMIQSGDGDSKNAPAGKPLGNGGLNYTVPAEFNPELFHQKGVLAAAREGDDVNPLKASSSTQFYIVQGKPFSDNGLDSVETYRLKRKIPAAHRAVYKTIGGTPHLDQNYTVFGSVVKGLDVVEQISLVPTSKAEDRDRPLKDVVIFKAKLIKRKKYK